jgi:hypothetical protein
MYKSCAVHGTQLGVGPSASKARPAINHVVRTGSQIMSHSRCVRAPAAHPATRPVVRRPPVQMSRNEETRQQR